MHQNNYMSNSNIYIETFFFFLFLANRNVFIISSCCIGRGAVLFVKLLYFRRHGP